VITRTRIIGCGTEARGDDAAGLRVAQRLRALGIDAQEHTGDGLSLMETWQGSDAVILVDAVVTGGNPGEIRSWDGLEAPVVVDRHSGSSHFFGVAEAIKLARVLDRLPPRLTIYGIEAADFAFGSAPCPEVDAATERLALQLASLEEA